MKRLMLSVFISLFLSFFLITPALSENYEQYQIPSNLEDRTIIAFEQGDMFSLDMEGLHWERNGQTVGVLTYEDYPYLYISTGVIALDDNHYGILMNEVLSGYNPGKGSGRIEYWKWSGETADLIRVWESGSYELFSAYCDKGFLIYEKGKNAVLYDIYANECWRGDLCSTNEYRPYRLRMRSTDDWICALNDHNTEDQYNACVRVINGKIVWQKRFDSFSSHSIYMLPLADGWTVVSESRNDGKYSPARINMIDSKGNIFSTLEISSVQNLLTDVSKLIEARDGAVLIYGKAVSNSQKIYLVWQLSYHVDSGTYLWDIRNCEYHGCYGPSFLKYSGNSGIHESPVSVRLRAYDGSGAPTVFIPFEKLPVVTRQYLTITPIQ